MHFWWTFFHMVLRIEYDKISYFRITFASLRFCVRWKLLKVVQTYDKVEMWEKRKGGKCLCIKNTTEHMIKWTLLTIILRNIYIHVYNFARKIYGYSMHISNQKLRLFFCDDESRNYPDILMIKIYHYWEFIYYSPIL